jgi:TRAP transporter 4TM/12TM fusion protein
VSEERNAGGGFRPLARPVKVVHDALLVSLALLGAIWSLEIHADLGIIIFKEQFLALIFTIGMVGIFIAVPARKAAEPGPTPWYDWLLAAASVVVGFYVMIGFPILRNDLGSMSADRMILGTIAVILVMEATRRVAGWALLVLAGFLIFYALTSDYFPGFLEAPGESWDRLAIYMYLDGNALFGFPLTVTASMIIAFIIFGRMLYAVNGAEILTDFAMAAMGGFRGGPAKVAVLASSFFGTISGSAVANVLMDGPITIPMMRKSGYPGPVAAAIEAVASTGGQIMPPVMGITAFIMAEFLSVPYGEVVLAALLPALLYYVALFAQVDIEAARHNLGGLPRSQLPSIVTASKRGLVFVIPIAVLIYTLMFERWQPGKSAMAAAIVTIIIGALHPYTRPSLKRLMDELRETGRIILDLMVITAIAGIIIGLLQLTGLAFNVSLLLAEVAGGSLPLLLLLTAVVCTVLGMGMPSAVIYIVLSVIAAPALVEAGVVEMSAHLFLFYFGMLSMITPPVCLATIAAASVAGTNFWQTGWAGVRLGFAAYVVPFLFVYYPELIFVGSPASIVLVVAKVTIGLVVMCYALTGFMCDPLNWAERGLAAAAGLVIVGAPLDTAVGLICVIAALAVSVGQFLFGRARARRAAAGGTA